MLFAQFEREMIAERTYEKMAEQARQGRWGGGHPILGYDVVNKRLVVITKEAEVVRAIYRKYLEIASLSRTARWANLQGHRTKGLRYSNGREIAPHKFTRADIQRLLTNVLYIGKVRFDDVHYQAEHDAIVPEDLFWEVQNLLAAKKEKPRRGDQTQQDTLLLGLLRCGFCGSAYTSSFVNKKGKDGKPKRYYYYKCTRKTKHEAAACPAADLRADIIDEAFVKFFRELSQEPDKLAGVLNAAEDSSKEGCGTIEKERNRLSAELAKAERQAMTLVGRLEDPEFLEIDAIKFRLAELNAQQQVLKAQITDLTLQLRDRRDQSLSLEEVREAYQQFEELWEELTFPERQYAVRLLVRQVELFFRRGEGAGQIKIEAWGRSPTPISVRLHDFRERKLRNQDVWLGESPTLRTINSLS
jgi:site-specific DNA recombinase